MILVSACLLGENCKYSGGNNYCQKVLRYIGQQEYVAVCPELLGGLDVPRPPAERKGDLVINKEGRDVTAEFSQGAEEALRLAEELQPNIIILKEGSPSCGVHRIYDGSFSGISLPGQGVTAQLLQEKGFIIISEDDLPD